MTSNMDLYDYHNQFEINGSNLIEVKIDKLVGFHSLKEHNFFELLFFLSGEGIIEISGISYTISSGSFCYLTPFHLSQLTVKGDLPLKYMVCKFDWGYIAREHIFPIPQIEEVNHFLTTKPFAQCDEDEFATVLRVFEQLLTEYCQQQDSLSSLFIRNYVMSLCFLHFNLTHKNNEATERASLIIQL